MPNLSKIMTTTVLVCFASVSKLSFAQTSLKNPHLHQLSLGLNGRIPSPEKIKEMRICVLGNGFTGYVRGRDLLPEATIVKRFEGQEEASDHGLAMAQIVWGVLGRPKEGPEFHLVQANGISNLRRAVSYCIEQKVKIVLYSNNWTFGSNFDGLDLIPTEIQPALDAGIIWINSVGNFFQQSFSGPVLPYANVSNQWPALPGPGNTLRFRNDLDKNRIELTLSWNDFATEASRSSKDLDVELMTEDLTPIRFPNKIQSGEVIAGQQDNRSAYPRETATLELDRGVYQIRIVDKSGNFTEEDKFRMLVRSVKDTKSLNFIDANSKFEVVTPADMPDVIAVGDCSPVSSRGKTATGVFKPDIAIKESFVELTDGTKAVGSSNSAALFTAAVLVLNSERPSLSRGELFDYFKKLPKSTSENCRGLTLWQMPR